MNLKFLRRVGRLAGLAMVAATIATSTAAAEFSYPDRWTEPFPPFRIIGNLYGVGGYDLQVFLLTSPDGHILVNTGVEGSTEMIRQNMAALDFRLEDVRILLSQQAHIDHTVALAEIKKISGAKMFGTRADTRLLEDGGRSDPHFGDRLAFPPVKVDRQLEDGDVIRIGGIELTTHLHPGHTEGSSSYSTVITENGRQYRVLIANMGTVNEGKKLFVDPTYSGAGRDFAETFRKQLALNPDIFVAPHAVHYGLHSKYQPGQPYDPETFFDPVGYRQMVLDMELKFLRLVVEEQLAR